MKPTFIKMVIGSLAGTLFSFLFYRLYESSWLLSLTITLGTIAYHLTVRLLVGSLLKGMMHNHADYYKRWYQTRPLEERIYGILRVKQWKGKLPTYEPEWFSLQKHTLDEVAQAMCQSEIIHEINVVLSFLPLFASIWFGSFMVFCVTSVAAACFDMMFVVMQRYNRPRIVRIVERQKTKEKA